jgi:hypothetical protein
LKFLHRLGSHSTSAGRDQKPQKGVTLPKGNDLRLSGAQLETERPEHLLDYDPGLLRPGAGLPEHHEIVGLSDKLIAEPVPLPVQTVQHEVRQQRRDDTSLRGPHRGGFENTVFHHAGLEELLD